MDGNEQVGFSVVGNLGTSVQSYESVFVSGIDNTYIIAITFDKLT